MQSKFRIPLTRYAVTTLLLTAKTLVLLLLQGCYSIQKIALQFLTYKR